MGREQPKVKYDAHHLAEKPDDALRAVAAILPKHSKLSESEVVHERACKDGSILFAVSREGAAVTYDVRPPVPKPPAPPVPST